LEKVMGIDRIGKGGSPTSAPPPATGPERATAGEGAKTFEVHPARNATGASGAMGATGTPHTAAPGAVAPAGAAAASPLARLQAGEINLDRYLDLKVGEATAHLNGLGPKEMAGLRAMLREQLGADPSLLDLVAQATGQRAAPKE
jgi:hypothetical protein